MIDLIVQVVDPAIMNTSVVMKMYIIRVPGADTTHTVALGFAIPSNEWFGAPVLLLPDNMDEDCKLSTTQCILAYLRSLGLESIWCW